MFKVVLCTKNFAIIYFYGVQIQNTVEQEAPKPCHVSAQATQGSQDLLEDDLVSTSLPLACYKITNTCLGL